MTVVAMGVALLWHVPSNAGLLNFEDLSSFALAPDGSTITGTSDGVNFTIRRPNDETLAIADHTLFGAAQFSGRAHSGDDGSTRDGRWGRYSIDPFSSFSGGPNAASSAVIITFSQPIHAFSLLAGDYGEDPDFIQLLLYNSTTTTAANLVGTLNINSLLLDTSTTVASPTTPLLASTAVTTPAPFTQRHASFFTSLNVRAIRIRIGEGDQGNGNTDNMSVFLDRLFFSTDSFASIRDYEGGFSQYLADNNVFMDPDAPQSDPIPAPAAGLVLLALGAGSLLRRRRKA